ncbi:YCII-related domain protein [Aspergillus ellipticus CBS 707.79]|uniref:YCII-related domain protein n=1 Tax=Aspergillus ellipticus CBS 707.79 TaxID=1448320 RepID=A0A319DCL7_9EURO|nr:YCII-related domain protein [Aspergillus ellipticus CBS 707.79]
MSAKNEFLCIVPDKPGMMAKRLEVRSQHLEDVKPLVEAGSVVVGGAMLESHPKEGERLSFQGSMLVVVAESKEEAEKIIQNDIYTRSGVWNLEKAQIIPFKSAVRVGL